jgi:ATP-dependent protease Clp ATPase subunit
MARELRCSFCSRSEAQVRRLVAGGGGGHICDECVAIAARILASADGESAQPRTWARVLTRLRALVHRSVGPSRLRAGAA